ncbi:hypothetical protein CG471_28355 [Sphingobium sp. IP1]|uniref:helix-turn-helix domain-containing protein n=1 Tax=Sphingobium sp. IP1 TaxID=2021637 RepID=UPI000C07E213|nr:helix-turn-helix transcriptional regulator [Sphingobium sp. IP1]PHP16391.1 hypothetical protein CG471_28355 [Sphingobium sp. IP1]
MSARRHSLDLSSIGGRLQAERLRIDISQTEAAQLAGMSKGAWIAWESGKSFPDARVLAAFAHAGADVLFIITGQRIKADAIPAQEPLVGVTVRQALAMLDPVDRHRLLLDLLAGELSA